MFEEDLKEMKLNELGKQEVNRIPAAVGEARSDIFWPTPDLGERERERERERETETETETETDRETDRQRAFYFRSSGFSLFLRPQSPSAGLIGTK